MFIISMQNIIYHNTDKKYYTFANLVFLVKITLLIIYLFIKPVGSLDGFN